jgi:hypothetical protein
MRSIVRSIIQSDIKKIEKKGLLALHYTIVTSFSFTITSSTPYITIELYLSPF